MPCLFCTPVSARHVQQVGQLEILALASLGMLQRPGGQLLHKELGGLGHGAHRVRAHAGHLLVHHDQALDQARGEAKGRGRGTGRLGLRLGGLALAASLLLLQLLSGCRLHRRLLCTEGGGMCVCVGGGGGGQWQREEEWVRASAAW